LLVLLAESISAQACSLPVFRVALLDPKWRPEHYGLYLFHDGPVPPAEKRILNSLNDYLDKNEGHLNCTLRVIDLAKEKDEDLLALYQQQGEVPLPYLVVRYPDAAGINANLWAGPLKEAPLRALLDSPARRTLGKRLLSGESAVWVLVESGEKIKDDMAFALLTAQLGNLQTSLKLPDPDPKDVKRFDRPGSPPLKLAFSTLRLSRTDPAEKWFAAMLLGMDKDAKQATGPVLFVVYGRGIAHEPLIDKGINHVMIARQAEFVIGECACEVRRLNPGKDILMPADWDTFEELPGLDDLLFQPVIAGPAPAPVPGPGAIKCDTVPPAAIDWTPLVAIAVGLVGGLIIVGGFGFYLLMRAGGRR
jgi:hypothetical protein